jgi:hypothetical protein
MMEFTDSLTCSSTKEDKILELNRKIQFMSTEHKLEIRKLKKHYLTLYSELLWKYINPKSYADIKKYASILMDHFGEDINLDIIFRYLKKLDEIEDIDNTIQRDIVMNYDKDMTHNDKIYEMEKSHNDNESRLLILTRKIIETFVNENHDEIVLRGFKGKLINLHLQGESLMFERSLLRENYFLSNLCKQISKSREYNDKKSVFNMIILQSNKMPMSMLKYPTDTLLSYFNCIKNKFIKNFQGDGEKININIAQAGYVELYARYPSGKYIVKTNTVMANILLRFNDSHNYTYKYCERSFMKQLKLIGLIKMDTDNVIINDNFTSDKIFISTKTTSKKIAYKRPKESEKHLIEIWIYQTIKRTKEEYTRDKLYAEYIKYVENCISEIVLYNNPNWNEKKYVFTILEDLVERGYIEKAEYAAKNKDSTYKYVY